MRGCHRGARGASGRRGNRHRLGSGRPPLPPHANRSRKESIRSGWVSPTIARRDLATPGGRRAGDAARLGRRPSDPAGDAELRRRRAAILFLPRTFGRSGLRRADPPPTYFARSSLERVDFRNTDLSGSRICWNDFDSCDFRCADLSGCDLRASTFTACFFSEADLRGARISAGRSSKGATSRAPI